LSYLILATLAASALTMASTGPPEKPNLAAAGAALGAAIFGGIWDIALANVATSEAKRQGKPPGDWTALVSATLLARLLSIIIAVTTWHGARWTGLMLPASFSDFTLPEGALPWLGLLAVGISFSIGDLLFTRAVTLGSSIWISTLVYLVPVAGVATLLLLGTHTLSTVFFFSCLQIVLSNYLLHFRGATGGAELIFPTFFASIA
jgi:hypothetical protein